MRCANSIMYAKRFNVFIRQLIMSVKKFIMSAKQFFMPWVCTKSNTSEDVGLANSNALVVANSAMQAYLQMGKPEGLIPLSHAIIYVCMSPKSNSVIEAMQAAQEDVENTFIGSVPDHLKNHNYLNEKRAKYKYPHSYGGYVEQQYLPDEIKDHVYYIPSNNGSEASIKLPQNKQSKITKQEN